MAYEVSRDLQIKEIEIHTPLEKTMGVAVDQQIVLVPILRAGLGIVGGFVEVMPNGARRHIGLFRDEETLKPVDYISKFHVILIEHWSSFSILCWQQAEVQSQQFRT